MKARCVKLRDVFSSMRFDGGYHNADVNVYDKVIRKHSQHTLDYYCSDIFTSGRTKRIYTEPEYGYPFLSNADVVSANPFQSCKYSSKKYGFDPNAVLKEGMILTGRVGAIGQTAFVPAFIEKAKAMGSDNIIRIVVKTSYRNGFIYAYLASKMGNLAFWKLATGGVQPFITDAMVGKLPIPVFPESFQTEVDNLIQESARLREEANDKLEEAIHLFEDSISSKEIFLGAQSATISSKQISSRFYRFDSQYQIGKKLLTAAMKGQKKVKLNDIKKSIFIGNRGKRCYVNKGGIPFLSSSNMMLANPTRNCKYISRNTPDLETFIVEKDYILISRSGTVGNTVMVGDTLKGYGVTEDAIRLVVDKSKIEPEYVFAYLKTRQGKKAIKILPFGSVIVHLNEDVLADVDLPIIDDSNRKTIVELVKVSNTYFDRAIKNENKAIKMVEDEIEKWNKAN
jgi:type I restriction enzyme S subunit